MGGYESTRWRGYQRPVTVDRLDRIEIGKMNRELLPLGAGERTRILWLKSGNPIRVRARLDQITLNLDDHFGADREMLEQVVDIEWTPCHLGGRRPWFICSFCGKRAGFLARHGLYFRCRLCIGLRYRSQGEADSDRAIRKLRKIQKHLGNPDWANVVYPSLPRPKGMHYKTYLRITAQTNPVIAKVFANFAANSWSSRKGKARSLSITRSTQTP